MNTFGGQKILVQIRKSFTRYERYDAQERAYPPSLFVGIRFGLKPVIRAPWLFSLPLDLLKGEGTYAM